MSTTTKTKTETAVIYTRLSEVRRDETDGIERQIRENTAHAKSVGAHVVETLIDNDITAADSRKKRPAFQRLMEGIAANEWDVVVVRSLDRWVRMPRELEDIIDAVEHSNVRVESMHGDIELRTKQGRMVARMMTVIAINEVDTVRERIRDWHADRAARGLPWGNPSFGYNAEHVVIPAQADVIRNAAQRVLSGESLASLAREWTELRHGDRSWTSTTVRRVLTAPRTAGLRQHNGDEPVRGTWEAILERDEWERVVRFVDNPARLRGPSQRRASLLTRILTCHKCGNTLNARKRGGDQAGVRVYRCRHCYGTQIGADAAERIVSDLIVQAVDQPALVKALKASTSKTKSASFDEIETLQADLDALYVDHGNGDITRAQLKLAADGIKKRLEVLRSTFERDVDDGALVRWVGQGAALAAEWEDMSVDQQRAVILALVSEIRVQPSKGGGQLVDPERIVPVWKF